jgi:hypothetical protein
MLSITPLLSWFFTLVLLLLAARATACLVVSRSARRARPPRSDRLRDIDRNREFGHAAMALGMAALLAPGIPRPPSVVSVTFFAALAAWATFDWCQRLLARIRGRTVKSCTGAGASGPHLLDPHHAIVSAAMVVMLLRPGTGPASASVPAAAGAAAAGSTMPGMTMDVAPSTPTLVLLGYVWIAALVLGVGMTRVLAVAAVPAAPVGGPGPSQPHASHSQAVLSSPATVYACELAMTVLTGLMLVT